MAGQDWTVPASDDGARLDKFLAHPERLVSRAKAFAAIDRGKVYVNDATVTAPATRLAGGDIGTRLDRQTRQRQTARPPRPPRRSSTSSTRTRR